MNKHIKVNGIDGSSLFPEYGYTVEYKKRTGNAGGMMLDGSQTEDVIAVKAEITIGFLPLPESKVNELLQSLYGQDYATVEYYDPLQNKYREIECIYSEIKTTHKLTGTDGIDYWFSGEITFTER